MNAFLDNVFESKWFNRAAHVALVVGSAYIMSNPKYAWLIPVLQVSGQAMSSPR